MKLSLFNRHIEMLAAAGTFHAMCAGSFRKTQDGVAEGTFAVDMGSVVAQLILLKQKKAAYFL
jgi:hypothetical protein